LHPELLCIFHSAIDRPDIAAKVIPLNKGTAPQADGVFESRRRSSP
jgi:hypothetical protein